MEENRGSGGVGGGAGSSTGLRRSRSSTVSMLLSLQLRNRNLLGGSSKKSLSRLDSLRYLSNIDYDVDEYVELRTRFEWSQLEFRALKREL